MFDHFFNQRIKVDGDLGNKPPGIFGAMVYVWCYICWQEYFVINTIYNGKGGCIYYVVDT